MDSGRRRLVQRSEWAGAIGAGLDFAPWRALAVAIFAAVWLIGGAGCVRTADCNESERCPSGEVCFQYECRERCETGSDCESGQRCLPCEKSESGENRCFGEEARACVPDELVDGG